MLILLNGVLLASLAILPQLLQNMMGYDAFTSGLAIMPRGVGAFTALGNFWRAGRTLELQNVRYYRSISVWDSADGYSVL